MRYKINYITKIALSALLITGVSCGNPRERRGQRGTQQEQEETIVNSTADDYSNNTDETISSDSEEEYSEPNEQIEDSNQIEPFNLKLFVENSGSMDGYVSGGSDFKNAMHSYLADLSSEDIIKGVNLYYANDKLISLGTDIQKFFHEMTPASFKSKGGSRKATDISQLLKNIIDCNKSDEVSIVVSDFIFSPGKQDAEKYLVEQEINIKSAFASYVKSNPDAGIMFMQFTSNFTGTFYNREDKKFQLKDEVRPFYMLIFGKKKYLKAMRASVPATSIKGSGVKNEFILEKNIGTPKYAVKNASGSFKLDRNNSKTSIVNAEKGRDGKLTFAVNVNFSEILIPESYILDAKNYELSDKDFSISVGKTNQQGYTHLLKLSSTKVKPATLKIRLKKQLPAWVNEYNDKVGLDPNADNALHKTYGLKNIINGISEAFGKDNYTELTININKN